MNNNSILQAENRVKEMNRMTQRYLEQSNRCMNSSRMQNSGNEQRFTPPRFEPVGQNKPAVPNMPPSNQHKNTYHNNMQAEKQYRPEPPPPPECENKPEAASENNTIKNILGGNISGDSLMIILLIAILAREKADIKLLLALGYLLL